MRLPAGVLLVSALFAFGVVMSGLSCIALMTPGGMLDGIWRLNPEAQRNLLEMGSWGPALMLAVCAACALSAAGLLARSRPGYGLAIGLLAVNLIADAANALIRGDLRTLIGLPVGGALIAYLLSRRVRALYAPVRTRGA